MLRAEHTVIGGKRYSYLTCGKKGRAILFLHGWLIPSADLFRPFLEMLGKDFTVYAPSMLNNHVESIEEYRKFIGCFVKSLRLKKLSVIGCSFGGAIAADFAAKNPKLVDKLIVCDSMGIPMKKPLHWWIITIARKVRNLRKGTFSPSLKGIREFFSFTLHLSKANIRRISMEITKADFRDSFKHVKCSTMILWGRYDEMFPVEHAFTIKGLIRKSRLKIIDGSHDWNLDYRKFYKCVATFLK